MGLAGAGIAVEQDVVRVVPGEEGLGIREKLLLLLFVADEVTQPHGQALLHAA